jgi:alpha-N-arabinofuranosidase
MVARLSCLLVVAACGFEVSAAGPGEAGVDDARDGSTDGMTDAARDASCQQPAAFWRFDEGSGATAADSSGHGHTLTLKMAATWTAGHEGSALSLPGASFADTPYTQAFAAAREISVTAWIKPAQSRTGGIVAKTRRLGPVQDWGFYQELGEAMFICNWPTPDLRGTSSGFAMPLGTWVHVAFVLDIDVGTTAFYKNGIYQSSAPITQQLLQNNNEPIAIGTDGGNTANDFIGAIDDITVWTRALTPAEVAALHAGDCL